MSDVAKLEEQLAQNEERIKLGRVLTRLSQNADFKEAIINQFSTIDCARYARESVDPALSVEDRASALAFAQAAGYLKQWIMIQLRFADTAESQKNELLDVLAEVRSEEANA